MLSDWNIIRNLVVDDNHEEEDSEAPKESALFLVVSSEDMMQLTITYNTFAVINNFLQVHSSV